MEIIDVHTHIGRWMFPISKFTIDDLVDMESQCGVKKCIISSTSAILYDFREGNEELANQLTKHTGFCYGYIVVNPHYLRESLHEVEKHKNNQGFIGIKLHPDQQQFSLADDSVLKIVDLASSYNMPLLVHTFSLEAANSLVHIANQFQDLPIIMAHMGGADWRKVVKIVADANNIFLDPCCSYADVGKIESAVDHVGEERVVFGSDATLFNPWFVIGMIRSSNLNESTKKMIFTQNACRIFGF